MWTLLLGALAWADCTPMNRNAFRLDVVDIQVAGDRGDRHLQHQLAEQLVEAVPCLQFAPSERILADFLVQLAHVRFDQGRNWEVPLAAALRLRPEVDLGVTEDHPMAWFELREVPGGDPVPVPSEAEVYVDGQRARSLPTDGQLHLVQFTQEGRWRSTLTASAPDVKVLTYPVPNDDPWRIGVTAGAGTAYTGISQFPTWESSGLLAPWHDHPMATGSVTGRLTASYERTAGRAEIDLQSGNAGGASGSHLSVAVGRLLGRFALGGGLGVTWVDFYGGVDPITGATLPIYTHVSMARPYASVDGWLPIRRCAGAASVGVGLTVLRGAAHAGCAPTTLAPVLVGATASGSRAVIRPRETDEKVEVWQGSLGVEVALIVPEAR